LVRVDPLGRNELRPTIADAHLPRSVVQQHVMLSAQQNQIFELGFAALEPMSDVVQCH
jgi:hypothetical protein